MFTLTLPMFSREDALAVDRAWPWESLFRRHSACSLGRFRPRVRHGWRKQECPQESEWSRLTTFATVAGANTIKVCDSVACGAL